MANRKSWCMRISGAQNGKYGPYVDGSVLARVLYVIFAGRCSHMFGLLMRHIARPLAIMLSAKSGPSQLHAFKDAVAHMRERAGFNMIWSNVTYSPIRGASSDALLVKGVDGACFSGELTFLMGPSGSYIVDPMCIDYVRRISLTEHSAYQPSCFRRCWQDDAAEGSSATPHLWAHHWQDHVRCA